MKRPELKDYIGKPYDLIRALLDYNKYLENVLQKRERENSEKTQEEN